ncbi:lipoprotein [Erwinia sp. AnSW2-5]|uniref:lipoprotein n=1 Tax=Erwinia sp. AnSW2-5 TaxID=3367692 RepID=UPI00385EF30D
MKKVFFGTVVALLLTGCVYVGNNFDENKLANVQKGVTTKQELISYFGEPSTSTFDSDGNETMMWTYSISNGFGGADAKVLSIKTHDGKVENYAVTRSKF